MNGEWEGGDDLPEPDEMDAIFGYLHSLPGYPKQPASPESPQKLRLFLYEDALDRASVLLRSTGSTLELHTKASRSGMFDDLTSHATHWWNDTYSFINARYIQGGDHQQMVFLTENPDKSVMEIYPL